MARAPFKLRSGNASAFKNLGSSPAKQEVKQEITQGFHGHKTQGGPTTIVKTTNPDGSFKTVETSNKTGQVMSEGGGSSQSKSKSSKPGRVKNVDLTKRQDVTKYVKGTKAYKAANPSKTSKALNIIKKYAPKVSKILGGKALGVAGMLMATSSKADQPKKGKGKRKYPGGKIDFTKTK